MRSIDKSFYNSPTWVSCSKSYLEYVNGLCELCSLEGKLTPARLVHHKIHMNAETVKDPALAYGFNNLQALCQECHNKIHYSKSLPKRYKIIDGELVIDTRRPPI